ncbi:hypothetical protein PVK06_025386 [Gossypium arboreum]|uniref:Uncharacterized protein n=1 Tax=Gossypium arboreum TaxID=29729 RepID=A0ABR0PGC4_GOSAR|nr:hypothetical protein PVK06_025386 [Gossypium arboreum]
MVKLIREILARGGIILAGFISTNGIWLCRKILKLRDISLSVFGVESISNIWEQIRRRREKVKWDKQKVLKLGCIHRCGGNWDHWLRWALTRLKGKSLLTLILKLAWNAFVHLIWAERNRRQFTSQQITAFFG